MLVNYWTQSMAEVLHLYFIRQESSVLRAEEETKENQANDVRELAILKNGVTTFDFSCHYSI